MDIVELFGILSRSMNLVLLFEIIPCLIRFMKINIKKNIKFFYGQCSKLSIINYNYNKNYEAILSLFINI